tara:strand:+ start:61255 stop:64611 length:3357 start_codon:yes stop_codon:yes gene_type:complete
MGDIGGHLSAKGAFIDTNNDGIVDGFAHTIKNAGNFNTFSLTNGVLTVQGPTGGAAIGGLDTHVQFNDGGVFGGESTFTYNKTSNTLNIANVVISGDLTVSGTTTTINTATLDVADNIITLNSDLGGAVAPSQNAGILINRGSSDDAQFIWDEGNDQWNFSDVGGTEHDLAGVAKVFAKGAGAVYTFTTDTDTGIEHTGTDQLGLVTGNTRVLMVSTNGVHIAPGGATGAGSNQALLVDDIVMDTQTISTLNSNKNLILAPHGSGSVELGAVSSNATSVITTPSAHNVIGTSVSIQAGSTTAGTTNNIAGGSLTLSAGQGKGTGAGGSILFKTADGGSSGSTLNPLTTKMTILDSGFVGIAQNTPTASLHVGGDAIISGNLTVSGTSTAVSTTNTFVTDDILTLNSGETANGVASGAAGIEIDRGVNGGGVDNTIARFIFDESDDKFKTQMETSSGSGSYNAAGIVASSVEGTTGTFSGDLTVDTNVLKVDTSNNRVGVNKAPTVALDVSGAVAGDSSATFGAIVQGEGILASNKSGFLVYFINNNASSTALGMPLRIDGSHATSVVQANQAQSNTLANCAVGLATGNTGNGDTGRMAVSGSLLDIPASSFTGSDPSDGDAVYVSGTAGKLTVDVPSTGYVQQIGRIQDTNVSVSGNSGTATIIISIGTPIPAEVYDGDAQGVTVVTGTLPIVSTGGATPAISINAATTGAAGSMSAADKTKLDGIEALADVTDATNVNAAGAIMHSDLGTKGDLVVGDGVGDATILSVGTDGFALTADSNEASGVKWAENYRKVKVALVGAADATLAADETLTLIGGTNVTLSENAGAVTINATGGGGGGTTQNLFETIAVSGQSNVVADSATDTLTLVAGSNMTITTNAVGDSITFASSGGGGGGSGGYPLFRHDKTPSLHNFSPFRILQDGDTIELGVSGYGGDDADVSVFTPEPKIDDGLKTDIITISDIGPVSTNTGREYIFYGQFGPPKLTNITAYTTDTQNGVYGKKTFFISNMSVVKLGAATPVSSAIYIVGMGPVNNVRVIDAGEHDIIPQDSNPLDLGEGEGEGGGGGSVENCRLLLICDNQVRLVMDDNSGEPVLFPNFAFNPTQLGIVGGGKGGGK